jgi:hypothetical protein
MNGLQSAQQSVTGRTGLRLLVCGGRDYDNRLAGFVALDGFHAKFGILAIISGAARGADALAAAWARSRAIPLREFPADWERHGKGAGHKRNQQMLDEGRPTGVMAFPGGNGTADMVRRARAADLPVWEVCHE